MIEMKKEIFKKFLEDSFPNSFSVLLHRFEQYYDWLVSENQKINLISRKTDPDDIWTHHFLDSLLSIKCVDFSNKRILDFGTGGGFPGVPLAILYSSSVLYLLDSTKKKIQSIKTGISLLKLNNCNFFDIRLEEIPVKFYGTFDLIVSRSVRMTPEYKILMEKLLKKDGIIVLYKSQNLDDVSIFENKKIYDVSTPEIGERKIVIIGN